MKSFPVILIAGLCLLAPFVHGDEHRPGKEAYQDEETGLVFPAELASLRKSQVVRNFNPLIGTTVRYADQTGNCADIYVYTLSSNDRYLLKDDLEPHYRSAVKSILNLPERFSLVKKVQLLSDQQITALPCPAWRACFQITQEGDKPKKTWLLLFSIRRHVIKLRFTPAGPKINDDLFNTFEKGLLSLCFPRKKQP